MSSWRTALRIAWREARRAKGRSALVVAMIMLPVAALAFLAAGDDTFTLTIEEEAARTMGTAQAAVSWSYDGPSVACRLVGMGDRWAEWLLERRFGGDSALRDSTMPQLEEFRDRVLAGARVVPGDVLLDVGCGDGLVAMGRLTWSASPAR